MTPTSRLNKRTWRWEPYEVSYNVPTGPMVIGDLADYVSPLSEPGRPPVVISGRRERREELKRNNLREVDPSEWKGGK